MTGPVVTTSLTDELEALRSLVQRLQAENARLLRLLALSPREAPPPGPAQLGWAHSSSDPVHAGSAPGEKVRFFASLFGARTDVYATRWESAVTGKAGWLPAVRGRWSKETRHRDRDYLPLTLEVVGSLTHRGPRGRGGCS